MRFLPRWLRLSFISAEPIGSGLDEGQGGGGVANAARGFDSELVAHSFSKQFNIFHGGAAFSKARRGFYEGCSGSF